MIVPARVAWMALALAAASGSARAEPAICAPTTGLQAEIMSMVAPAAGGEVGRVFRGDDSHPADLNCLLRPGDRVEVKPGARVLLMETDRRLVMVLSTDRHIVGAPRRSSEHTSHMAEKLRDFDLRHSAALARPRLGVGRGPGAGAAPALVPALPQVRQRVGLGRPLLLRWEGAGDVEVVVRDAAGREVRLGGGEGVGAVSLDDLSPGLATLALRNAAGVTTTNLELVQAGQVPVLPAAYGATEEDQAGAARSIWLLLYANPSWRLEALSRLMGQARGGDLLARAVLGGAP